LRLDERSVKRIYDVVPPTSPYWLRPGDLLIQRANSLEHVGTSAIFDGPADTYIYPDLMMRLRFADSTMTRFVWYYLSSPTARKYFRDEATGTAGNMPKINGRVVRDLEIPVPSAEHRAEAVGILDAVFARADHLEACAVRTRGLIDRLESAIVDRAYGGELVLQDVMAS